MFREAFAAGRYEIRRITTSQESSAERRWWTVPSFVPATESYRVLPTVCAPQLTRLLRCACSNW